MAYDILTWLQGTKKLYGAMLTPLLERYGLTQTEADVLMFLANNPQYDTARDIVEHRYLVKSHVSVSVESLVRRGLLERFRRDGNRKTIHLRVTEQARPIVAEGVRLQNRYGAVLIAGFSEQDIRCLGEQLRRIQKNTEAALAAQRAGTPVETEALQMTKNLIARLRDDDPSGIRGENQ